MKKMNLLYIFADQWRAHAVGAAGEDQVNTPYMDRFAQKAMAFDNAVSTYPLCSPHRASLMTGKYPYRCGMWTNCKIGLDEVVMLKPQEITISDVLHDNGYQTAYIGKWHLDASEQNFIPTPKSLAKHWDAYTPKGERRHHFDYWYSYGAMDEHMNPHYWQDNSRPVTLGIWSAKHETDVALKYLDSRDKKQPFCMFLSWNPPHPPYDQLPQERRKSMEDRELIFRDNVPKQWKTNPDFIRKFRDYYGAVEGLDEQFGRLIKYLEEEGLQEDTLVVLSADHGDCMGSHGLMGKNIWYEEAIRIPCYMRGPGLECGHTDVLFGSQDHMPTLLDIMEIDIPGTVEGRSLADFARKGNGSNGKECKNQNNYKENNKKHNNKNHKNHDMEVKYIDEPQEAFLCMIPGMPEMVAEYAKQGLNHKAFGWRGLRTKTDTYVVDLGTAPGTKPKRFLYHNKQDPYQMQPEILSANSGKAVYYDQILRHYLDLTGDPFLLG